MKSFKKFVAEVAQPSSEEEKRFKDQHTYEVIKHPVALDSQFTGEIDKPRAGKRKADQEGDANYDKMYKDAETRMVPESVEQIDEISKELAGRYIKKAQVSSADAGMDTASQDKNIRQRGIKTFLKRRKGVDSAVNRLTKESTADDRARYDAADDKDKKKVTLPKAPWDKKDEELSPKQKKIDANKNGKIDGHDLAMLRKKKNEEVELDETTSSAMKKMVTQTGPDGKTRTVMKKAKNDRMDDRGQDKIATRESAELEEAVKIKRGPLRLKDGSQIMVSKEDADLLSRMFSDLSANNQRQMQKVMMMDKAGFEEIRGFAREAL